jgi:hypothetical protein
MTARQLVDGWEAEAAATRGASAYRGVRWDTREARWSAIITVNKKKMCVYHGDDELEAAMAWDAAALKLRGRCAPLEHDASNYAHAVLLLIHWLLMH